MATTTLNADRTAHLLALMKMGDGAFNTPDFAGMKVAHYPDMVAHVMRRPQPIRGQPAHAEAIKMMIATLPDCQVDNAPYPILFGSRDWITAITRTWGTFIGEMVLPDGKAIAPMGTSFDLDFATTARWDGDLLIEEFVFWDSAMPAQQLGIA